MYFESIEPKVLRGIVTNVGSFIKNMCSMVTDWLTK